MGPEQFVLGIQAATVAFIVYTLIDTARRLRAQKQKRGDSSWYWDVGRNVMWRYAENGEIVAVPYPLSAKETK